MKHLPVILLYWYQVRSERYTANIICGTSVKTYNRETSVNRKLPNQTKPLMEINILDYEEIKNKYVYVTQLLLAPYIEQN
jgi:hypothetical protein